MRVWLWVGWGVSRAGYSRVHREHRDAAADELRIVRLVHKPVHENLRKYAALTPHSPTGPTCEDRRRPCIPCRTRGPVPRTGCGQAKLRACPFDGPSADSVAHKDDTCLLRREGWAVHGPGGARTGRRT